MAKTNWRQFGENARGDWLCYDGVIAEFLTRKIAHVMSQPGDRVVKLANLDPEPKAPPRNPVWPTTLGHGELSEYQGGEQVWVGKPGDRALGEFVFGD